MNLARTFRAIIFALHALTDLVSSLGDPVGPAYRGAFDGFETTRHVGRHARVLGWGVWTHADG